jgi:hypothetical protein
MPLPRLRRAALVVLAALALAAGAAAGDEALVEVNGIVLRADAGFRPQSLPRRSYAPIEFQGHVDLSAKNGGAPAPLQQALIEFDRDGRLDTAGLPSCAPESIATASSEEARRICRGAIVGNGHIGVMVSLSGGPVRTAAPLTIFNGPRVAGNPTVVLHAQLTAPATQTYAILVPIERISGRFRYRARLDLPPLAGGLGALIHIDVELGRRFRAGGRNRSYVSARCSDNILQTHGYFSFADGTVISGEVEKYCRSK